MINKFEDGLLQECLAIIDGEVNFGDGSENTEPSTSNLYNSKELYANNTCGSKNQQKVSLKTGYLRTKHIIYNNNGSRLPFKLSLSYNQSFIAPTYLLHSNTPLPAKGWKFNYQQWVKLYNGFAYYCDAEFNVHKLTPNADSNTYYDSENKTGLILTVVCSEDSITGYELTDERSTKLTFNQIGKLISITQINTSATVTNTITYDTNNRLQTVIDGLGKVYTFSYDNGITVTDSNSNVICSIGITSELLQLIETNSVSYTFAYINNLLQSVTDSLTNTKSTFVYDSYNRASQILNYEISDDNSEEVCLTHFVNYGEKKAVLTKMEKDKQESEQESIYYYFATNGDLIYLSDKQESLLENLTVASAKAFKLTTVYQQLKEEIGVTDEQQEYEVTTLNTGKAAHTQTLNNNTLTWYETEDYTFNLKYTQNQQEYTILGIKFTLADYTQTMINKFKSPSCFNVWYNDGCDLITNCSSLLLAPNDEQAEFVDISQVKYASLTVTDKATSYSYIYSTSSTQLTIKEYLHIEDDYTAHTSIFNKRLELIKETNYQNIQTTYTYDSYGDCTKTETNKPNGGVDTNLIHESVYTNGKLTAEKGYYNLSRPTVNYSYDHYGNISQVTDAKGNAYNYTFLTDGKTLNSVYAGGLYNELFYEYGRIKNIYTAGPTQDLSQERYTFNYNDKRELESVRPSNIPADNTTLLKVPAIFKSQPKIEPNSVITEDIDEIYAIEKHYDDCSRLRKIIKVCKSNHDYDTPLMYYYYWDDGYWQDFGYDEETMVRSFLSTLGHVDPLDSQILATKKAKLRVVLDKTSVSDYNRYERYNSYGIVYNANNVEKIIYPNTSLEYSVEARDYIGRTTQIKTATDILDVPYNTIPESTTITNNIVYQDYFTNKITNEEITLTNQYYYYDPKQVNETITTSYTHDNIDRVTQVNVSCDGVERKTSYSFAPAKKLNKLPSLDGSVSLQPGGTTSTTSVVGTTNLISQITETGYGSTATTQIEYDSNGNITKYGNTTYVYDSLNRLTRENNYDLDKTIIYEYDNSGNLFRRKEYAYTTGTISSEPTASTVFIGGNWVDQVKTVRNLLTNEDKILEYNDAGRATSFGNLSFNWNDNGNLISSSYLSQFGTLKTEYLYGDSGNRVSKINYATDSNTESSKVHFRYLNGNLVYQVCESVMNGQYDPINFIYNSMGLIGFFYNHELYEYRKNLFGDITEIYKGTELVAKYVYDAWGNHKVCNPDGTENFSELFIGNINPLRYRGYYYDVETGLYYLKSRYYSPTLGRFISPDGIEYLEPDNVLGLNLYAYCYNNPIMYVDSTGHFPVAIEIITTIIDGAMGLYAFGLNYSLKYLKATPKVTMKVAKKLARKGGHIQSARQIIRNQQNLITFTKQSLDDVVMLSKKIGKVLLVADVLWTIGENYASGDPNWISDSVVDVGISIGIYGLGAIPGVGWTLAIGAVILTEVFDDKIEEFKDWFANEWNEFWSFSWI